MLTLAIAAFVACTSCGQSVDKVPRIELATLATAPDRFNGKEVIVSGMMWIGEGRYMIVAPPGDKGPKELMYLAIDGAVARNANETTRAYLKWPEPYAVVTIRGRFMVAAGEGFGNQNVARFKLEVHDVIAIEPYKER